MSAVRQANAQAQISQGRILGLFLLPKLQRNEAGMKEMTTMTRMTTLKMRSTTSIRSEIETLLP